MLVLNLTQHNATPEQRASGVFEPVYKKEIQNRLTFEEIPTKEILAARAGRLADIAYRELWAVQEEKFLLVLEDGPNQYPYLDFDNAFVMIGGAPFFMSYLEDALKHRGLTPVYAFSKRESVETTVDGKVSKTSTFIHKGFVGIE